MAPRSSVTCALAMGMAATFAGPGTARAQEVISREVVQQLPSGEVQRLNRALVALAQTPRDRDALIEAGQAALGVDDLEAAIGFFGRAAEVDPGHSGAAQGLASVYLRAGRAGEALVQFDRALAAGVPEAAVASDRALTLDLVGEQPAAQAGYLRALQFSPADDEARRRLATSYAISGNRAGFEEALRPLLDKRDMAAQRTRAFGLAIMGDSERATAIVEQVMPRDLATRLVPYLGYMPRLTKPQQAAAANLGIFPRAADIGRDDPRLARFAAEERADNRLAPSGPPLGARALPAPAPTAVAVPAPTTTVYAEPVSASAIGSVPPPARVATVAPVNVTTAASAPGPVAASVPAPLLAPAPLPAPLPAPQPLPAPVPAPLPQPPLRVADAFADLGAPLPDARVSGDAVDISRIAVKREAPPPPVAKPVAEKPKPKEPPKPVHPSRVWVQVATGRKIDALAFDWRRISKEGGKTLASLKPHTARWGQTNRLVVGPVASRDKAEAMVRELKAKGLDSFLWLSDEGEEVQALK
ncbi:SPOR domain-containing protein [Porphyrobacter sp. TH134]|uniref:SPOR domain-containing protein n=1 Tax=Porphyrobacter sp. TH134 TaxID=2067450 RepID=UPI001F1F1D56|nr:SPOR domain-containing protein [Porphyrobacter sp. TH134]